MARRRVRVVLNRLLHLLVALDRLRHGRTAEQLRAELGVSRSTFYRDLKTLEDCDLGLIRETINGEVRLRLPASLVTATTPTPLQHAALRLAREALREIEGLEAIDQLDALLRRWGVLPQARLAVSRRQLPGGRPDLLRCFDSAVQGKRRMNLEYQGARDQSPQWREIDPVALRLAGEQPYLFAFDHERKGYRVFKLSRATDARKLDSPALDHTDLDVDAEFARSVKVWVGEDPVDVAVLLAPEVARLASEYPLVPDQTLESYPDGSVMVRAKVNGITEAVRWVLGWGAQAEAIAPLALRKAVQQEVTGAADRYRRVARSEPAARPSLAKTDQHVSQKVRHSDVKVGIGRRHARERKQG